MLESEIIRSAEIPEIFIAEGCFIRELFESPDGIVSFADARLSPGQRTENHILNVDEYYYIRSGTGDMYLNGILTGSVKSGELVKIKKHDAQYIHNTGAEDLVFLCVCIPTFQKAVYTKVESYL